MNYVLIIAAEIDIIMTYLISLMVRVSAQIALALHFERVHTILMSRSHSLQCTPGSSRVLRRIVSSNPYDLQGSTHFIVHEGTVLPADEV